MDAARIEAWALEIVDRLKAGQPIEDIRVEVKREWVTPERTARRLAGHANAARGDAILWLVGLDERDPSNPVVGVDVAPSLRPIGTGPGCSWLSRTANDSTLGRASPSPGRQQRARCRSTSGHGTGWRVSGRTGRPGHARRRWRPSLGSCRSSTTQTPRLHQQASDPTYNGRSRPWPTSIRENEGERWLSRWGLSLGELSRELLADVERQLAIGDKGQPLAPSTASRYRKIARRCITRSVELGSLDADPWPPTPAGRSRRKARRKRSAVDIRRLPDPATMAAILQAIPSHQPGSRTYQAMTAVIYFAGLRPSEVVMLRPRALRLPDAGWGAIDVVEADVDWDESGEPKTGNRTVPIPPELVGLLRRWIDDRGLAAVDLLFRTRTGRRPTPSNWGRTLKRACVKTGRQPMRVYDCRHACATAWLRAGVPLGEVARRLGHGVETPVSIYVGVPSTETTSQPTDSSTMPCVRLDAG
jgi:integrase